MLILILSPHHLKAMMFGGFLLKSKEKFESSERASIKNRPVFGFRFVDKECVPLRQPVHGEMLFFPPHKTCFPAFKER